MSLSPSQSKVYLFYDDRKPTIKHVRLIKSFIARLFKREQTDLKEIHFVFCSDQKLLGINRNYLRHNYYTDVISFDLSVDSRLLGEVYISVDRVRENSKIVKTSFASELLRVMIHGALHLCGYKDDTSPLKKAMQEKEDFYLENFKKRVSRGTPN